MRTIKTLDIIVPVYNEAACIPLFHAQLSPVLANLKQSVRIIYVDDGSSDGSSEQIASLMLTDARVIRLVLTRNFGHQAALAAGLDRADADAVLMMDGDGQHPACLISEMLHLCENGYDIVGTQRQDSGSTVPAVKRFASRWFYTLINRLGDTHIVPGSADFRLVTREVHHVLKHMHEHHKFYRGMVSWLGYKTVLLPFDSPQRLAGSTKYSLKKMFRLASDGIFSFSIVPLHIGIACGVVLLILSAVELLYVLSFWITGHTSGLVPGWSSLMFVILVTSAANMMILGFVGIYIGMIFHEIKQRPVYIVKHDPDGHESPVPQ